MKRIGVAPIKPTVSFDVFEQVVVNIVRPRITEVKRRRVFA
jgi:hypothetical protein